MNRNTDENLPEVVDHVPSPNAPLVNDAKVLEQQPHWVQKYDDPPHDESQNGALPQSPRPAGMVCGLKRKTFWIAMTIIIFVVICAVVGGALGATIGKKETSTTSSAPATTAAANSANILHSNTAIAAVNFTSTLTEDTAYHVFTQRANGAVEVSVYSSTTQLWTNFNVSITSSLTLELADGTSIAASSRGSTFEDFKSSAYLITSSSDIYELSTTDIIGNAWTPSSLGTSADDKFEVRPNSSIAAANNPYLDGPHALVVCQKPDENIMAANRSGDNWLPMIFEEGEPGTGIAMINDWRSSPPKVRVYFQNSTGVLQEQLYSPYDNTGKTNSVFSGQSARATNSIAAATVSSFKVMLVAIQSNGSLVANYWDSNVWNYNMTLNFDAATPYEITQHSRFTSIALTGDMQVFGVVDGVIYWWTYTETTPTKWTYVGQVDIEND